MKLEGVADNETLLGLFVRDTRRIMLGVPGLQMKETGPTKPLEPAVAENVILTLVGDHVIFGGAELGEGP